MDVASVIWVDINGRTRQTIINTASGSAALVAALQAGSRGGVQRTWESTVGASVGSAVTGTYQSVADTARLIFQTSAGNNVRLTLPAPQLGLFLADKISIDPANTTIVAIVSAALAGLTDQTGLAVTSFIGGYYSRAKGTDLITP